MNYRLRPGGKVHAVFFTTDATNSAIWLRVGCRYAALPAKQPSLTSDPVTCKRCLKAAGRK